MLSSGSTPLLHYWVAARPLPGQAVSGDQHLVAEFAGGVLVAVVDGLGHGAHAHAAATVAIETLRAHADEHPTALMNRCHEALRKTRGVVMTLASFHADDSSMNWLAIGNVEAMLIRAAAPDDKPLAILPRGGIVGERLPMLTPAITPVQPGDLLLLATDGIGSHFFSEVRHVDEPGQLVLQLFLRHAKNTDDALLLGAQWTNGKKIPARLPD